MGDRVTESIRDVEQMPVFQSFAQLALGVEKDTRGFGPDFRWLRVQCLRSSESVCANMAEGFYSQYSTEYLQGLYRSRREARETVYHVRYALGVGQLENDTARELISAYEAACVQLANVITSIERKISQRGKAKDMPSVVREELGEYEVETLGISDPISHLP
jgi:four helix bundle protein